MPESPLHPSAQIAPDATPRAGAVVAANVWIGLRAVIGHGIMVGNGGLIEGGHAAGAFPNAERAAASILSLPMFPELTRAQCDQVCAALRAALQ